ncbi:RmuC domain protein [Thermosipho africanus H17ap60334]|nr:RmuC domain protein [Thermosipho africanus H17ap60334]
MQELIYIILTTLGLLVGVSLGYKFGYKKGKMIGMQKNYFLIFLQSITFLFK